MACGLSRKLMHGTLAGLHHSSGEAHQAWVQAAQRCFLGEAPDAPELADATPRHAGGGCPVAHGHDTRH
jgi:hypothetical protein